MLAAKNFFFVIILSGCISCGHKTSVTETETEVDARTPVTVTAVSFEPLEEFVELNATSTFLQKSYVKSNLTGYIKAVNTRYAAIVNAGQVLFTLKTKESDAIGNTINRLDPSFRFSGVNVVRAGAGGYVSELDHQAGDYVQDGEQLAVISNLSSFVFVMNVPYEYKQFVSNNKQVELTLPDGVRLLGTVQTSMPFMDSVSQTQSVAIKVHSPLPIPQNLVAKVKVITSSKAAAISLPKPAVLSDETQSDFWVMKMINDSTAVKVPVKKGIETGDRIEIVSPAFNPNDKILLTGNYGLPDTVKVKIEAPIKEEK
ncbi:MAG TPA: efflux RND transporter periplasmic adaptor subunit [Chitinophagaceae bacterium]|nr:efflux RND transporter periplasmic adaptor subunit [Chitinophagaceae bacterium]